MQQPQWWLWLLGRVECVLGWAGAITIAWIYLWYTLTSDRDAQVLCIACLIIIGSTAMLFGLTSCIWKTLLNEMIEKEESERDQKDIQAVRWPPVER